MDYNDTFLHKKVFNKKEIEDILKHSKPENKKYLYDILSLNNVSMFCASYIMNRINLNFEKIQVIKNAVVQYEKREDLYSKISCSDFLFNVVRNMEKLENSNETLLKQLKVKKEDLNNISKLVEFLISNALSVFDEKQNKYSYGYVYTSEYNKY